MKIEHVDQLAFAIMATVRWAVDGGKIQELSRIHEELVEALTATEIPRLTFTGLKGTLDAQLSEIRDQLIEQAVTLHKGDINAAARVLGISRTTVYRSRTWTDRQRRKRDEN